MTAERWRQIETLFHAAHERPAAEREAFLDRACAGDPTLRAEVGSLLANEALAGDFLESDAKSSRGPEQAVAPTPGEAAQAGPERR